MTFNCKIIFFSPLFLCVCTAKTWSQEDLPGIGSALERRARIAAVILEAAVGWFGPSSFQSKGLSFPTKILPPSAARWCWRPAIRTQDCPSEHALLAGTAGITPVPPQLVQRWGPPAVIKSKLKGSKEAQRGTVLHCCATGTLRQPSLCQQSQLGPRLFSPTPGGLLPHLPSSPSGVGMLLGLLCSGRGDPWLLVLVGDTVPLARNQLLGCSADSQWPSSPFPLCGPAVFTERLTPQLPSNVLLRLELRQNEKNGPSCV